MMKRLKRATALFLCPAMTLSQGAVSFAQTGDDNLRDYSVSDVSFDVSNDRVYVSWSVGGSHTSYMMQLYSSSDLKSEHKIDTVVMAGYTAKKVGTTDEVLKRGAGTYYAQVTAKKKAKRQERAAFAMGAETITTEDIITTKRSHDNADKTKTSVVASTATSQDTATQSAAVQTQTANTQSTSAQNTAAAADYQMPLENGGWNCMLSNGQKATGWFQVGSKWYCAGNDGATWADAWIKGTIEEGVYYYVGYNGGMLVSAQTPGGYLVDYAGRWRP